MSLRDLGFDLELEQFYRLVLALSSASTVRLADALAWDVDRACVAVRRLEELGLVRTRGSDVIAADPASSVGTLIEQIEEDLLDRYRRVSATRSELSDLVAAHRVTREPVGDPQASVQRITDLRELVERIEELSFFTRTSLSTMQPGGPSSAEMLESARPLDDRGLRRGISMRIIREPRALDTEDSRNYLINIVARGAQVRITDAEMHQMLVMDDTTAIVPIDNADKSQGALVIRQPVLVAGFCDLFERTWDKAVDITALEPDRDASPMVSEADRTLLRMLTTGVTDEVAARELSISVRHLRRHVSRLMAELSATSRFAAGVEAGRRGWI